MSAGADETEEERGWQGASQAWDWSAKVRVGLDLGLLLLVQCSFISLPLPLHGGVTAEPLSSRSPTSHNGISQRGTACGCPSPAA